MAAGPRRGAPGRSRAVGRRPPAFINPPRREEGTRAAPPQPCKTRCPRLPCAGGGAAEPPPLPPLLPPRRVPGRVGRLRGTEVGAPPAPRGAAVRGVSPRGGGRGRRRSGRPFQGRSGEGARVRGRRDPAARAGTVPSHVRRRRSGPLRAHSGNRRRERGGHCPAGRAGPGASREDPAVWGWLGSVAGAGSAGRGFGCGTVSVAVGLVFCRRPRPRLPRDRAAQRTLAASAV